MIAKTSALVRTTPFPNSLLDTLMPSLKDTEWRLVCVIVRQTLGWKDSTTGTRKSLDWLSQRQLIKRTGRSSEAISRALNTLVRVQIIEVSDGTGQMLDTATKRRKARGRVFYALHPRFLPTDVSKRQNLGQNALINNSLLRQGTRKSEYLLAAKANGTKENTKENDTNSIQLPPKNTPQCPMSSSEDSCSLVALSTREFAAFHYQEHIRHGYGIAPSPSGIVLSRLEEILRKESRKTVESVLEQFFHSEMEYIQRSGRSLNVFVNTYHLLNLSGGQRTLSS